MKQFNTLLDEALRKAKLKQNETERQRLMSTVGKDIAVMLAPFLNDIASNAKVNRDELKTTMAEMISQVASQGLSTQVDTAPIIEAIQVAFQNIPQANVRVEAPKIDLKALAAKIRMPDEMNISGWIGLMGYDKGLLTNPLPVQLRDVDGKPVSLNQNSVAGGGFKVVDIGNALNPIPITTGATLTVDQLSGANWSVSIAGATGSIAATIVDSSGVAYSGSNPLPVTSANTLDVKQLSGAIDSINLQQTAGNPTVVGTGYQDNALRVVNATDAITSVRIDSSSASVGATLVDSTGVAYSGSNPLPVTTSSTTLDIKQVSGQIDSVNMQQTAGNPTVVGTGYQDNALRIVHATDAIASVRIDSSSASVSASIVDSTGVQYSGSNPLPVNLVSQSLASSASALVDSSGVQYSGSNPLTVSVSGSLASVVAVGLTLHDSVDDGDAPLKMGGIAATANPTAVAGGDRVNFRADDLGRQLVRPFQVRDLIKTAYTTITTGTETTLLAGTASTFNDLIYIMMANSSDAAVVVDVRPGTANGVVMSVTVPASGTAGISPHIPLPQEVAANAWTVDMPDITGTSVYVTALFSQEI